MCSQFKEKLIPFKINADDSMILLSKNYKEDEPKFFHEHVVFAGMYEI